MTEPADRDAPYRDDLDTRAGEARLRRLTAYVPVPGTPYVERDGTRLLSFCSNDYLGLATHREVIAGAVRAAETHGAGTGASRLVVGGFDLHDRLERSLADLTRRPAALLFNSGFQANSTIIPAVTRRGGVVLCDEGAHRSLLEGGWRSPAVFHRFRHNDAAHLDRLLAEHAGRPGGALVVTESLFSMDGDLAPLDRICAVADRHGARLLVDDAHAIGVHGPGGAGLAAAHDRIDLLVGTFGKAFGSAGAFVACSETLRAYLVNFCAGVIYSTAPAPPAVGAAAAALALIRSGALDQTGFLARVGDAHHRLRDAGFDTAPSTTQIMPIRLGDDRAALACETHLRAHGILAVAIRPPTVPDGTARLRISLSRLHTAAHLDALVSALEGYRTSQRTDGPETGTPASVSGGASG